MKLWTIQERTHVEAGGYRPITNDWTTTQQDWRNFYTWMAQQWNVRVGRGTMGTPLWCWHSCNGVHQGCPTVGTLNMLMGDWNYYAPKMILIEMCVPDNLVLLSSYWRWNEAIDDAMERRSDTIDGSRFADMFDMPLFKHETDDIQAVIPRIEREWVIAQWLLPRVDANDVDWDMPCTSFREMP